MSKFNVGDKVRVLPHDWVSFDMEKQIGKIGTIILDDGTGHMQYRLDIGVRYAPWSENCFELVEPRREFIVIRRSGAETIAELRHDREAIKSAKATCAPSDTFNLDTGAKLAFDRLMGREEPKPAPQPAHRFKVGDRVVTKRGNGTILLTDETTHNGCILVAVDDYVCGHNGCPWTEDAGISKDRRDCMWDSKENLSPAPAPEPPKFYTGKVAALRKDGRQIGGVKNVCNRVFDFVDGVCAEVQAEYLVKLPKYESIEHLNEDLHGSRWIEIKE